MNLIRDLHVFIYLIVLLLFVLRRKHAQCNPVEKVFQNAQCTTDIEIVENILYQALQYEFGTSNSGHTMELLKNQNDIKTWMKGEKYWTLEKLQREQEANRLFTDIVFKLDEFPTYLAACAIQNQLDINEYFHADPQPNFDDFKNKVSSAYERARDFSRILFTENKEDHETEQKSTLREICNTLMRLCLGNEIQTVQFENSTKLYFPKLKPKSNNVFQENDIFTKSFHYNSVFLCSSEHTNFFFTTFENDPKKLIFLFNKIDNTNFVEVYAVVSREINLSN